MELARNTSVPSRILPSMVPATTARVTLASLPMCNFSDPVGGVSGGASDSEDRANDRLGVEAVHKDTILII